MDYSGVQRDLDGNPIPNGIGGFFDHIHEMQDSYRALIKAKRSIEGSLNNPNINPDVKAVLEDALKIANAHIERIDNLFEPYGGIENWNRE